MSRSTRRELLNHARKRYIKASWREKGKVLDEFIALTGYGSVSPVFEKPSGTSKSPAGTKTGDKYASGGPGRPASAPF